MIHKFESQDFSPDEFACRCLSEDDPEYYQTFAFCTTHDVWWKHKAGSWSSWEKIDPEDADKIVPDWMKIKAYGGIGVRT